MVALISVFIVYRNYKASGAILRARTMVHMKGTDRSLKFVITNDGRADITVVSVYLSLGRHKRSRFGRKGPPRLIFQPEFTDHAEDTPARLQSHAPEEWTMRLPQLVRQLQVCCKANDIPMPDEKRSLPFVIELGGGREIFCKGRKIISLGELSKVLAENPRRHSRGPAGKQQ